MMRGRHGLRPAADNDFAIITQDKLFETWSKISGMFFLVMFVLSAIGLLVGGVGDGQELAQIKVDDIAPNARQPRRRFEPEATAGLAESIKKAIIASPAYWALIDASADAVLAGDSGALAQEIIDVLKNDALRARLGEGGRCRERGGEQCKKKMCAHAPASRLRA